MSRILRFALAGLTTVLLLVSPVAVDAAEPAVKLAVFDVDATPPLGSAMAYDPVKRLDEMTLRCRGIVLLGAEKPIVLCAVDWIGIANEGHDAFRDALAEAAGTTPRPRGGAYAASTRCSRLRLHGRADHPRAGAEQLRPLRRDVSPPGHRAGGRRHPLGSHKGSAGNALRLGRRRGQASRVESPHPGRRWPRPGHALHGHERPRPAGRAGGSHRSAGVAVIFLERRRSRSPC